MAYNYGPPPGAYGMRQPSYPPPAGSNLPGVHMGSLSNYGAPPGMDGPPGMVSQSPVGIQHQLQPPPNFANINVNAPVIRLGVDGPRPGQSPADRMGRGEGRGSNSEPLGNRGRAGLGAGDGGQSRNIERERQQVRENMMALQPPTREEVARTIFVGKLDSGAPSDDILETLLRCAGKLRRWTRVRDSSDKKCNFGFAEYEDVESLEAAAEIFPDMEVPIFKPDGTIERKDGEESEVKMAKLMVKVDPQSLKYIEEWKGRRREDDDARQFRIDGCKEDLRQSITGIINSSAYLTNGANGQHNGIDHDGDVSMGDTNGDLKGDGAEVVTIAISLEDELADIPADMRATVAAEIKSFRDRSNRRDLERLREEEYEQERQRNNNRLTRQLSPPLSAPSGPASSANGVPVRPRNHVQGAPSGPKGYRGAQQHNENIVRSEFVPGAGPGGRGMMISISAEDEEAEESDEELEQRRVTAEKSKSEAMYRDAMGRWEARSRQSAAARKRERDREEDEETRSRRVRDMEMEEDTNWNDEDEAHSKNHTYYSDRGAWLRLMKTEGEREDKLDDDDRQMEDYERLEEQRRAAEALGQASSFLDQMGSEMEAKAAEQVQSGFGGVKFSLGGFTAKKQATSAPVDKRGRVDIEQILADEEDAIASGLKRPELKPLEDMLPGQIYTDEEKRAGLESIATTIPIDKDKLFAHPIKWDSLTPDALERIRAAVGSNVLDMLGVKEEFLVDTVMEGISQRKKPQDMLNDLEPALDEEAETLVKKVWRTLVIYGEGGSRGFMAT